MKKYLIEKTKALRQLFVSRSYFEVEKPIMCKYSEKHTEAECKLRPLRAEMYKCDLCLHSIDYRRPKKEYDIDGGYKLVYPK